MAERARITAIAWERVHLTLLARVDETSGRTVEFHLVDGQRDLPVVTDALPDGEYRLRINVTTFQGRKQVPNGTWRFVPYVDGEPEPAADFDLNDLQRLDECSRVYLYNGNTSTYVIAFGISEDEQPELLMRTYQLSRSGGKKAPLSLGNAKSRLVGRVMPKARKQRIFNRWYRLWRRFSPPPGNRILFASEMRSGLEGNLLRIRDRMRERGLDGKYRLEYSFRVPNQVTRSGTFRLIRLLASSDVVLVDDYLSLLEVVKLDPETKIIQAWHAGSGFKSIGYSRFGNYGSPKLSNPHRVYTYAIAGSQHLVPVYAEAFGIEESAVIPTGLPRIDTFLDDEQTQRTRTEFFETYPHLAGKRLVLFAPTFRGRGARSAFYDYSLIDWEALHRMCGEDTRVLFRAHHFVPPPVPIPDEYADRIFDFTSYPSINDLLHVTDILITDYSSIIYEFSLLERPILFFAYDRQTYAATRGFHRDFELTAPGKICDSIEDVVTAIENEDFDMWKLINFRLENFDRIDTHSADRVIDWLILSDPHPQSGEHEAVDVQTAAESADERAADEDDEDEPPGEQDAEPAGAAHG
jgi:CDP-ribitol ribitolphosphotransferase